jgi:hypothetical protein
LTAWITRAGWRFAPLAVGLSIATIGVSVADEPGPTPREPMSAEDIAGIPTRFDHSRHITRAVKAGSGCEACHQLEQRQAEIDTLTP